MKEMLGLLLNYHSSCIGRINIASRNIWTVNCASNLYYCTEFVAFCSYLANFMAALAIVLEMMNWDIALLRWSWLKVVSFCVLYAFICSSISVKILFLTIIALTKVNIDNSLLLGLVLCSLCLLSWIRSSMHLPLIIPTVLLSRVFNAKKKRSLYLVTIACTFLFAYNLNQSHFDSPFFNSRHYHPSFGVFWYLSAVLIPGYELYFEWLCIILPIACSMLTIELLHNRTNDSSMIIVLIFGCLFFFGFDTTAEHILFIVTILTIKYPKVITEMKYYGLIVTIILITSLVSPAMAYSWIVMGSGNSNFLFFQGLVLWVFYGLFLIEFIAGQIRLYEKDWIEKNIDKNIKTD